MEQVGCVQRTAIAVSCGVLHAPRKMFRVHHCFVSCFFSNEKEKYNEFCHTYP